MDANQTTIVETRSGKLEGFQENGIYAFKGVPFAAPSRGRFALVAAAAGEILAGYPPS